MTPDEILVEIKLSYQDALKGIGKLMVEKASRWSGNSIRDSNGRVPFSKDGRQLLVLKMLLEMLSDFCIFLMAGFFVHRFSQIYTNSRKNPVFLPFLNPRTLFRQ